MAEGQTAGNRLSQCLQAFESKEFRLYLAGQAFSTIGTGMQNVALGWLVYRLTHSPVALGLFAASTVLPQVLLSFAGGCLADGKNKKRVLSALQYGGSAVAAILLIATFLPNLNHAIMLLLAFLYGAFIALEYPARHAFTGRIVAPDKLVSARGLYSSTCASMLALGQLLGGFIIEAGGEWGERACFLVNMVSYAVALILLRNVSPSNADVPGGKKQAPAHAPQSEHHADSPLTADHGLGIKYCIQYVLRSKILMVSFLQTAILVLFCLRYISFLPAFASEVFHGGAGAAGILSAAVALGYAVAAFFCGGSRSAEDLSKLASVSLLLLPVALVMFSLSPNLPVGVACVFLMAFFQSANINANVATMQVTSPDWIFGRLMGLRVTIIGLLELTGALVASQFVNILGLAPTMVISAVVSIVFAGSLFSNRFSLGGQMLRQAVVARSSSSHGKD